MLQPPQWQQLDVRIQIAPQIEDHFLFKRVVQDDAQRVEPVLKKKGDRGERE